MPVNATLATIIILCTGAMLAYNARMFKIQAGREKFLMDRNTDLLMDITKITGSCQELKGYKEKYFASLKEQDELSDMISKLRAENTLMQNKVSYYETNMRLLRGKL